MVGDSGRSYHLTQCSALVKTNLLSLQEQLEMVIDRQKTFQPTRQLLTTINEDLEALESIYQCGLAQERISNDVLSLGRIQLGKYLVCASGCTVVVDADRMVL